MERIKRWQNIPSLLFRRVRKLLAVVYILKWWDRKISTHCVYISVLYESILFPMKKSHDHEEGVSNKTHISTTVNPRICNWTIHWIISNIIQRYSNYQWRSLHRYSKDGIFTNCYTLYIIQLCLGEPDGMTFGLIQNGSKPLEMKFRL